MAHALHPASCAVSVLGCKQARLGGPRLGQLTSKHSEALRGSRSPRDGALQLINCLQPQRGSNCTQQS